MKRVVLAVILMSLYIKARSQHFTSRDLRQRIDIEKKKILNTAMITEHLCSKLLKPPQDI